jgi:ribosomal peptide maturation radical SAM protein 1
MSKPVAGILSGQHNGDSTGSANFLKNEDMERLPYPDYDDFFQQMKAFREMRIKDIKIPFEMTRGCAWGARHRCSFCGIDGASYATRRKSAERVINELEMLIDRYPAKRYLGVDSLTEGERYHTILPWLSRNVKDRDFFFETSGALSENHVKKLAAARALEIQPGIENLSNPTLKLMGKPTNAQKNIQTLKWCRENGVFCYWNYLMCVPGESDADLDEIVKRIEAIHHLQPPRNEVGPVWIQRFSKYFDSPSQYGLEPLQVVPLMYYIYPFPENSLWRLSYGFYNNFSAKRMKAYGYLKMKEVAGQWYKSHRRSHLMVARRKDRSYILDTRVFRRKFWHRLRGLKREIYEFCGRSRPLSEIVQAFAARAGQQEVEALLHDLVENRLMLYIDGRYLSLATRVGQGYKFPFRGDTAIAEGMRRIRFSELMKYRRLFNIPRYRFAVPLLRTVGFKFSHYLTNFPPLLLHGIIYLLAAALGSKRKGS